MSVVVCGSVALDDVTTSAGSVTGVPGGSALFFAYAASIFTVVRIVSVVGRDFPKDVLEDMVARGMDISCLRIRSDEETFHWSAKYDDSMDTRLTRRLNPNADRTFDPAITGAYRDSTSVFLASLEPALQTTVLKQVSLPRIVGLDTIECYLRGYMDEFKELMPRADVLFLNDEEALWVSGESDTLAAARRLHDMGSRYVVVKKGSGGALLYTDGSLFAVPAYPCDRVVDPTGAGDAFGGGFMGYLSAHGTVDWEAMKTALMYGSVVASTVVEDFSIRSLSLCTREDIDRRFERFRDIAVK